MSLLEEKTIATEQIFNGKVISLQVDEVVLAKWKTTKRELIKHPGAVAIIAVTDDRKTRDSGAISKSIRKRNNRNSGRETRKKRTT